jgi:serine/threonine protein kinase
LFSCTVLLRLLVINNKCYDGVKGDMWSCEVIFFVLMAGYLPFKDSNLMSLYKKVCQSLA